MDIKTLEYMGERIDKARKLQSDIADINNKIRRLEVCPTIGIKLCNNKNDGVVMGSYFSDKVTNAIVPEIIAATINALATYRDQLQKELDEL